MSDRIITVSKRVKQRGEQLARDRQAVQFDDGDWRVHGTNRLYRVTVTEPGPATTCTCPYYENTGGVCAHQYAVLTVRKDTTDE